MLPVIDRVGRRQLFLIGAVLCMILHFTMAGLMASRGHYVSEVNGNANLRWVIRGAPAKGVIAAAYIFVAVYGFTWAPAAWIYCSEVFPLQYRAMGVGLSAATNWIFNFALAFFVSPAFTNIQWKTYIIFGVFCFAMTIHIFFFYPETKGMTLEEIDVLFDSKTPAWRSGSVKRDFGEKVEQAKQRKSTSGTTIAEEDSKEREKDGALHNETV